MSSEAPRQLGQAAKRWLAPAVALVAAAAVTALAVVALLGNDDRSPPAPVPTPTPTDTAGASQILRDTPLRERPASTALQLGMLDAGAIVTVEGRSGDDRWLSVSHDSAALAGWVPVNAVAPIPPLETLARLPDDYHQSVERTADDATPAPTVTLTPDVPDLVVADAFSRDNRLVVVVANEGNADVTGAIEIVVNGGAARRIDVGKALRPGDTIETTLEDEYVQRRASVTIDVIAPPGIDEEDTTNNRRVVIVEPDQPNDIEVLVLSTDPDDGHLIVTVRNNSPIPIVGGLTLAVRQIEPPTLLRLLDAPLSMAAGATREYDFPLLVDFETDSLQVIVSTSAIQDAEPANDILPR